MAEIAAHTHAAFRSYELTSAYDEMFRRADEPRPHYRPLYDRLNDSAALSLSQRQQAADMAFLNQGITLSGEGSERVVPYDLLPHIIAADEWAMIERGLHQRIRALNLFLHDIYHRQRILGDGVVPRDLVYGCRWFRREMIGVDVPQNTYLVTVSSSLVRLPDGSFAVLEDNLRVPGGISYMLTNRQVLRYVFPQLFRQYHPRAIEQYPQVVLAALRLLVTERVGDPTMVLLSRGGSDATYFEDSFLARQMGLQLVEGRDLLTHNNYVYMRTTAGLQRIDVIYRRVGDDELDPLSLSGEVSTGIAGLFNACRAGNVALANAIGTGIADDRAIASFVPLMIRYYLGEQALLPAIETLLLSDDAHRHSVLGAMERFIFRPADTTSAEPTVVGPQSSASERESLRQRIEAEPRSYIAQPLEHFSRVPCFTQNQIESRPVALCAYAIYGKEIMVVPGALTRVALQKDAMTIDLAQGGNKDTWVLEEEGAA